MGDFLNVRFTYTPPHCCTGWPPVLGLRALCRVLRWELRCDLRWELRCDLRACCVASHVYPKNDEILVGALKLEANFG